MMWFSHGFLSLVMIASLLAQGFVYLLIDSSYSEKKLCVNNLMLWHINFLKQDFGFQSNNK
jgi:hypothetical protein